jgi:hypothetical protein
MIAYAAVKDLAPAQFHHDEYIRVWNRAVTTVKKSASTIAWARLRMNVNHLWLGY